MTADNTEKLIEVRDWIRKELDTCVNFWLEHGMDRENGGVYTCLDRKGEVYSTDKSVWMQVPTEILGQSVAWIRLRPVQNKIGTATTYDTATIASNGQVANAFTVSYAALRYNK